jgi:hypothetical protein
MQAGSYATSVIVAVCCLLIVLGVPQAAGSPTGRRTDEAEQMPANCGKKNETCYDELKRAFRISEVKEQHIGNLQVNAHCPFQVFEINGYEIVCDRSKMSEDILNECHQAYDNVTSDEGGLREIKVGCIYHPKGIHGSVEADNSVTPQILDQSRNEITTGG